MFKKAGKISKQHSNLLRKLVKISALHRLCAHFIFYRLLSESFTKASRVELAEDGRPWVELIWCLVDSITKICGRSLVIVGMITVARATRRLWRHVRLIWRQLFDEKVWIAKTQKGGRGVWVAFARSKIESNNAGDNHFEHVGKKRLTSDKIRERNPKTQKVWKFNPKILFQFKSNQKQETQVVACGWQLLTV